MTFDDFLQCSWLQLSELNLAATDESLGAKFPWPQKGLVNRLARIGLKKQAWRLGDKE
jgi:hypothetical protein